MKLALFISLFLFFLILPTDPDLGWHLKCGQLFWQNQSFCSQNEFSVFLPNYQSTYPAWLYQSTLFSLFNFFGPWSLTVFNALLLTLTAFFFYHALKTNHFYKILSLIIILFFSWGTLSLGIRSQLLGLFFFSLLLYLIPKKPKFVPIIMLIWANTHGSFILGLILILVNLLNMPKKYIILSFLATLINPFTWRIYHQAWIHFAGSPLSNLIAEWVPPSPPIQILIILIFLITFTFLIIKKPKPIIPTILTAGYMILALKARRHIPFFFLANFYFLAPILPRLSKHLTKTLSIIATTFIFSFALIRFPKTISALSSWPQFKDNPMNAINFLQSQPPGRIFNRYEWGGLFIWYLPEHQIFIDGRMPAWPTPSGKSPYTIYLETLQTQPGWQKTLQDYKINWIFISPGTFMDLLLKPNPEKFNWQEAYRDDTAVIYKKIQ